MLKKRPFFKTFRVAMIEREMERLEREVNHFIHYTTEIKHMNSFCQDGIMYVVICYITEVEED